MTDKDKLLPFIEDFMAADVAGALKGIIRRKITFLKKKTRSHANYKEIERQINTLSEKADKLTEAFPDRRGEY